MFTFQLITLALFGAANAGWQEIPTVTEWSYITSTVIVPEETYTHTLYPTITENVVLTDNTFEKLIFTVTSTLLDVVTKASNKPKVEAVTETSFYPELKTVIVRTVDTKTCTVTNTEFKTTTMAIDVPVTMTHVQTLTKFDDEPLYRTKTQFVIKTDIHRTTVTSTITSYTPAVIPHVTYH